VKIRDIIKLLEEDGWTVVRQRGSHRQLKNASKPGFVKYLIVIESTATGFSAYSPDVPGCVATGDSREEAEREMRDAISFHLDGLRQEGAKLPEPQASSTYVEVPARHTAQSRT